MAMNEPRNVVHDLTCGICGEDFDEEVRCPRIFCCFHTLCTSCIDNLIRIKDIKCPFCRNKFKANNAKDVRVNHTMVEFMRYISLQKSNLKRSNESLDAPRKKRINDFKKKTKEINKYHQVKCHELQEGIEKTIKEVFNLRTNIIQENNKIEKDILSKFHDVVSQNNIKVKDLENRNERLRNQLQEIKDMNHELTFMRRKLDTCSADTFKETGAVLDDVEKTNTDVRESIKNFTAVISDDHKILQTSEKELKRTKEKTNIILEVLNSQRERNEEVNPIPGTSAMANQEENLPMRITTQSLIEMTAPVKCLVEHGKIIAIREHVRRKRWAALSISNDNLCIHYLRDDPVPTNVHVVQYDALLRLVSLDPAPNTTFLELGVGGATLGRLYICHRLNTRLAENFISVCAGHFGPSYAETVMLGIQHEGTNDEAVYGGDYESNDGEGGKAVMPYMEEENWESEEYELPSVAGAVMIGSDVDSTNVTGSQFLIFTRDDPDTMISPCIGIVEEGLHILIEAISDRNIRDVVIRDCGIVLHRMSFEYVTVE